MDLRYLVVFNISTFSNTSQCVNYTYTNCLCGNRSIIDQKVVVLDPQKPRSRFIRVAYSDSVFLICVIVAWQWKGVPRIGLTPLGPVVSDLAQHLAERTVTVVLGWCSLKTAFCFVWWFQKCRVSERKVHCTVQQQLSKCLPKRYSFCIFHKNRAEYSISLTLCICMPFLWRFFTGYGKSFLTKYIFVVIPPSIPNSNNVLF